MQSLQEILDQYEKEIRSFAPATAADLQPYRIKFLGTKGIVKQVFGEMKNVPPAEKRDAGQLLNAFKEMAELQYEAHKHLQDGGGSKGPAIDASLPGDALPQGTRHPLRVIENKIVSIFEKIGFS